MRGAALAAAVAVGLSAVGLALSAGCTHREPPAPEGFPSVALPEVAAPGAAAPSTRAVVRASTDAARPSAAATPAAPLVDASPDATDPSLLPQTRDEPQASGPRFDARVAALWDGIIHDDPDRAMPFFFPLGAYRQVKDVYDPAADWKHRLVAAYRHDVHELHAKLGADAAQAKLVGLDVPQARARWVDPGEEYNKIGYYRVFGSKLRYDVDGRSGAFDVKSLISWRGEWFVVHLSAIR